MNAYQLKKTFLLFVGANFIFIVTKIIWNNNISELQLLLLPITQDSNSNLNIRDYNEAEKVYKKSLWRPTEIENSYNFDFTDDRIDAQFSWINKFSSDPQSLNITKKKILLFDTGVTSLETTRKIRCPDFELNLCTVVRSVDLKSPYKHLLAFDAVIFSYIHWYSLKPMKFPSNVKQIIYTLETPFKASTNLQLNNAILASYYRGADIVIPYKKWLPFEKSEIKSDYKNIAASKIKMAIAIISNCLETQNNRLGFIKELKKYLDIDVYGRCGHRKLNCTRGRTEKKCMNQIIKQYKFYFAFENANCEDYITEKVFSNALGNKLIPVVMGARLENYEHALPPHSFIHVENYKSPKELAEHLNLLNNNDSLYNEYFNWQGTGKFRHSPGYFLCRICGMLFYDEIIESHPPWRKDQVSNKDVNICLPSNKWYWNKL